MRLGQLPPVRAVNNNIANPCACRCGVAATCTKLPNLCTKRFQRKSSYSTATIGVLLDARYMYPCICLIPPPPRISSLTALFGGSRIRTHYLLRDRPLPPRSSACALPTMPASPQPTSVADSVFCFIVNFSYSNYLAHDAEGHRLSNSGPAPCPRIYMQFQIPMREVIQTYRRSKRRNV